MRFLPSETVQSVDTPSLPISTELPIGGGILCGGGALKQKKNNNNDNLEQMNRTKEQQQHRKHQSFRVSLTKLDKLDDNGNVHDEDDEGEAW